jgi:hypothetical protein
MAIYVVDENFLSFLNATTIGDTEEIYNVFGIWQFGRE